MKMMIPTVHINGTDRNVLMNQQIAVLDALRDVQEALQWATPNGRDYYQQGDRAGYDASMQFSSKCRIIEDMIKEFEAVLIGIDEQKNV